MQRRESARRRPSSAREYLSFSLSEVKVTLHENGISHIFVTEMESIAYISVVLSR